MKKERTPNKVFNRKIKGKCPRGRYKMLKEGRT
jgi:hypothetical protein